MKATHRVSPAWRSRRRRFHLFRGLQQIFRGRSRLPSAAINGRSVPRGERQGAEATRLEGRCPAERTASVQSGTSFETPASQAACERHGRGSRVREPPLPRAVPGARGRAAALRQRSFRARGQGGKRWRGGRPTEFSLIKGLQQNFRALVRRAPRRAEQGGEKRRPLADASVSPVRSRAGESGQTIAGGGCWIPSPKSPSGDCGAESRRGDSIFSMVCSRISGRAGKAKVGAAVVVGVARRAETAQRGTPRQIRPNRGRRAVGSPRRFAPREDGVFPPGRYGRASLAQSGARCMRRWNQFSRRSMRKARRAFPARRRAHAWCAFASSEIADRGLSVPIGFDLGFELGFGLGFGDIGLMMFFNPEFMILVFLIFSNTNRR